MSSASGKVFRSSSNLHRDKFLLFFVDAAGTQWEDSYAPQSFLSMRLTNCRWDRHRLAERVCVLDMWAVDPRLVEHFATGYLCPMAS